MERVSLDQLARRFVAAPLKMQASVDLAMTKSAILVRDTAVKKFGTYQSAVGEFPAWEPLQPETVARKTAAGSAGDDPLIGHYSGKGKNSVWPAPLRMTISMKVEGWVAAVGSDDPLAEYHEYGTVHIPPRPFLRPSLFEKAEEIQVLVSEGLFVALRNM
jgi:phage gpG-like protein